jgi:hypothetical protein
MTKGNILDVITKKMAVNYAETRNFFLESVSGFIRYIFSPDGFPQRCKSFSNYLGTEKIGVVEFRCTASRNGAYTD